MLSHPLVSWTSLLLCRPENHYEFDRLSICVKESKSKMALKRATRSIMFVTMWTSIAFILEVGGGATEGLKLKRQVQGQGFREIGLQLHNDFRQRYGYLPLELSSELNKLAHNHAEYLANTYQFGPSSATGYGAKQNMWAHRGELRPISLDVRDAVLCWFTGNCGPKVPSTTIFDVKPNTLYSPDVHYLGIGVGTSGEYNYTVVVANYM